MSKQDRITAAALARLERLKIKQAFDPFVLDSRPTAQQTEIFKGISDVQIRIVRAGNRCLAKGTLVATPRGPVPIEDIQSGDTVYDENGNEITVLDSYNTGKQEVVEITNRNVTWAESTLNHKWQVTTPRTGLQKFELQNFRRDDMIVRQEISSPLGSETCNYSYALGALLGDGCSRQGSKHQIHISSEDESVVQKVTQQLDSSYSKCPSANYTWKIYRTDQPQLYVDWCKDRYAHEKIVDLDVIKQWDRKSLLEFIAGLIDTDGSIYVNQYDNLCIQFGMQAKSVVEAFQYACLALWNTPTVLHKDDRDKYVNGPVWYVRIGSNAFSHRILKELSQYLQCTRKQWKEEYVDLKAKRSRSDAIGWKLSNRRYVETYDLSVDSPTELFCLANGLVTSNSGKSALAARELTWILNNEHPYWERPKSWGSAPLTCLVVGKSRQNLEVELWSNKIRPFLNAADWKEIRSGNVLQKVENKITKDSIIFLTHADSSDRAVDNLMGYTAHYVWCDEMPSKLRVLEELIQRVSTTGGPFLATFTPKVVNLEIKKYVDSLVAPVGKRYPLNRLDNPVFADTKSEEMAKIKGLPAVLQRAILTGEWMVGADAVYQIDLDSHMRGLPENYHKGWRHVESIDPGTNVTGYTLWAEDPSTDKWYCVSAQYLEIRDPAQLFQQVEKLNRGYNIVRRVCDPAATWYIHHAATYKVSYTWPYAKNQGRNAELIKGLQTAITDQRIIFTPASDILVDELVNCMWNDNRTKIVNHHKYHTMDCAKYFVDCIPKPDKSQIAKTPHQFIYEQNEIRKQKQAAKMRMMQRRRKW